MSTFKIELIVWYHKRRIRQRPYSASALLVEHSKAFPLDTDTSRVVIAGGSCSEVESEAQAARGALRELQEKLSGQHDPILRAALADPVTAVTERRSVA